MLFRSALRSSMDKINPCLKRWKMRIGSVSYTHLDVYKRQGIGAHAHEIAAVLPVLFDPHESCGFVCKAPRLHDLYGLRDIRERCPHKAGRPPSDDFADRQGAYFRGGHGGVMLHGGAAGLCGGSGLVLSPPLLLLYFLTT